MNEKRNGARARHRLRDLLRYHAGLPYARNNDLARATIDKLECFFDARWFEPPRRMLDRRRLKTQLCNNFAILICHEFEFSRLQRIFATWQTPQYSYVSLKRL